MTPKSVQYYEWGDFAVEICKEMGIKQANFRDYHTVVHPDIVPYSKPNTPYYDCWHVWMSVFDKNVKNDSYSAIWFWEPDEPGDTDGEWGYIEEEAVKEYGEWARTFVKAVCKVAEKYKLFDQQTIIHYSW